MRRISDALFGNPKRLDRELWLSRFSDLMLNGIQFPAHSPIDLAEWRRAVREGQCGVYLRGYSHIFVSGPSDAAECSDFAAVAESEGSYQEVYLSGARAGTGLELLERLRPTTHSEIRRGSGYLEGTDLSQTFRASADCLSASTRRRSPSGEVQWRAATKAPSLARIARAVSSDGPAVSAATNAAEESTTNMTATLWANPNFAAILSAYQGGTQDSAADAEWLKTVENLCKGALQQFQLQSKLLSSSLTPNAALLKFQGSANLTVEQVLRRRSEFLTTHKLNVISVRAEPGIVAIAIARHKSPRLHLPEVWKRWNPDCSRGNQTLLDRG